MAAGAGDIAPVDNEGGTTMSVVYTTETMANRAFAAEIRHDPVAFTALLEETLDVSDAGLGEFVSVRCEGIGDIDLLLTFTNGNRSTIVGIESKFDHELTAEQVDKELQALNEHGGGHLVVVLPEVTDASEFTDLHVLAWADVLGSFRDSRLTNADVDAMPLTKRRVERVLRDTNFGRLLTDPGWKVHVRRNGNGNPSIEFHSPKLTSGRTIRGQIQVTGQGMPTDPGKLRLEYSLGIEIRTKPVDVDFPDDGGTTAPIWAQHLATLRREVLTDDRLKELTVSLHPAPRRSDDDRKAKPNAPRDNKLDVAEKHLKDERWLVKGYTDKEGWALGVKSTPHRLDELDDLCTTTARILNEWLAVEPHDLAEALPATAPSA
ncbi:hypothetical protein H489_0106910 [Curtobacterium flaccumfaciens UCD-AKU]|nr:hypothetical protein H489_0106910 [Curtobacterium flaccumfaciens UCD-AKU]